MDFGVIVRYGKYLLVGAYPDGPIGGLLLTLALSVIASVFSFAIGIVGGLMRTSRQPVLRAVTAVYVEVVRGIPFIMVLFWFHFLLPRILGHPLVETRSSIGALTFFFGAYATEIVRAGILSVPEGQSEAAQSTGLTRAQTMAYIILPQALRHMVPSLVNLYVSLIKDTSLVYFIGVIEITGAATQVMRRESYAVFEIFAFVLLVYWIVCSILSGLSSRLEEESTTA